MGGRWIVGKRYDLAFFTGSVLASPLLAGVFVLLVYGFHVSLLNGALLVYFAFTLIFDAPHIFQTFSRTHADPAEFARHRTLHLTLLPVLVAMCIFLYNAGYYLQISVFFQAFGAWHIARQNIGFLKLYQRLGEDGNVERRLDRLTYYAGWFACMVHTPLVYLPEATIDNALTNVMLQAAQDYPMTMNIVEYGSAVVFLALAVLSLARTALRGLMGRSLNAPKLLFMWMTIANYVFVFVLLRRWVAVPALAIVALETIYHDIQYHAFIGHYQRARFPNGILVARRWLLASLAYGAGVILVEAYLIEWLDFSDALFVPIMGIVMWHYYIDGRIWKFGQSPELQNVFVPPPGRRE